MRESIGGAWLFGIVIVFIFMFSGFLAYSISYTKAFNVKNEVVNYIEHNRGFSKYNGSNIQNEKDEKLKNTTEGKIYMLIRNVGYEPNGIPECDTNDYYYGVCIVKYCTDPHNTVSNTHYKVTTYIKFGIDFLGLHLTIPISGETSTKYDDNWNYPCSTNTD